MTIRRTLLISYLLIGLSSVCLITLMIFIHLKAIIRSEIENKLTLQASNIMQQIDTSLFERMENMVMWSRLDVMQEIRVHDVDKRLASFLHELHDSYDGIYQQLFVVDNQNQIIAADNPSLIGLPHKKNAVWLETSHKQHAYALHSLNVVSDDLYLSIAINDDFRPGQLGRLYTGFNWQSIIQLLNQSITSSHSYALLVDADNRILATSSNLDKPMHLQVLPQTWQVNQAKGVTSLDAEFLNNQPVLVGYAQSQGYLGFTGFGWRVLILQAQETALAPMWDLWLAILIFLGLTVILAGSVSLWMSAKLAKPIVQLAQFTRDFMAGKHVVVPLLAAQNKSDEIRELVTQFSLMIDHLEQSRRDVARVAKLAVIGEMAASMAHEVRTPLGILRSSAQMLQREKTLSDIGQEMAEFILSETQRLNDLITTLLACARPKPPQLVKQDIHFIIEHCVDLLQSQAIERKVALVTTLTNHPAIVNCDRDLSIQVILNLVMNALQHVHAQGHVEIRTQLKDACVEITVSDDGVGISDADKMSVFDPFFTKREQGIGLGLTVVQQTVLAHQGRIFVTDSSWGGACFHVLLPLADQ